MKLFYHTIILLAFSLLLTEVHAQSRLIAANDQPTVAIELGQNYPNPSTAKTQIPLEISSSTHVKIEVFNLIGAKVKTLVDKELNAGRHNIEFDTSQLKSGVYLYRLTSGDKRITRRMTVTK